MLVWMAADVQAQLLYKTKFSALEGYTNGWMIGQPSIGNKWLNVNADWEWERRLKAQGLPEWQELKSVAALPVVERKGTLGAVVSDIYSQAQSLEPAATMMHLHLKPVPFTDAEMEEVYKTEPGMRRAGSRMSRGRGGKPSEVSEEMFQKETETQLEVFGRSL